MTYHFENSDFAKAQGIPEGVVGLELTFVKRYHNNGLTVIEFSAPGYDKTFMSIESYLKITKP